MNVSRAVLVTATEEGYPSVIYESFVRNKREVYVKSAYVVLRSMEDAREAANEALLKIYLRWEDALASESIDAFGSKILHDVVVDMLRKRDRRPCSPAGLAFESVEYPIGTATADEFEQLSLRMELHQAIELLPAQQRNCIQLHYLLDYSVDDVAAALGVAASTVRSHLATARTALASRLGVPDEEPAANEKGTNG